MGIDKFGRKINNSNNINETFISPIANKLNKIENDIENINKTITNTKNLFEEKTNTLEEKIKSLSKATDILFSDFYKSLNEFHTKIENINKTIIDTKNLLEKKIKTNYDHLTAVLPTFIRSRHNELIKKITTESSTNKLLLEQIKKDIEDKIQKNLARNAQLGLDIIENTKKLGIDLLQNTEQLKNIEKCGETNKKIMSRNAELLQNTNENIKKLSEKEVILVEKNKNL